MLGLSHTDQRKGKAMWMNESEVERAVHLFSERSETPNLGKGADVLYELMDWTNGNSDGWPYWQKPSRAAAKLMDILQAAMLAYYNAKVEDITEKQLRAALSPIKAFLTRQGVDHSEIFGS
jgi:hypothetical protein